LGCARCREIENDNVERQNLLMRMSIRRFTVDQRVLEETGESRRRWSHSTSCSTIRSRASDASCDASDGIRNLRSRLVNRGNRSFAWIGANDSGQYRSAGHEICERDRAGGHQIGGRRGEDREAGNTFKWPGRDSSVVVARWMVRCSRDR
jgi:hypothetical protein